MKQSAGILLYRRTGGTLSVMLAHPGGPFWRNKDSGAWTIIKGEFGEDEAPETAARREFAEETGLEPPAKLIPLGAVKQAGGKIVHGFAGEMDCDPARLQSNEFEIEWPPKSGRRARFPEIERTEWFALEAAAEKINPAQTAFLDRLAERLTEEPD